MVSLCKKIIAGGLSENIAHLKKRFLFGESAALFIYAAGFFIISAVLCLNGIFGPSAFISLSSDLFYDCSAWIAVSCLFLIGTVIIFARAVKILSCLEMPVKK